MNKIISEGNDAMAKILAGINLVANPVKATISPMGRTVILSESKVENYGVVNAPIIVSKDGFRVSQSIASNDPEIQVGVKMMQDVAEKQVIDAGDATSTVCLLTQKILTGGIELIKQGANHVEVVKGINYAVDHIVKQLKKMAIALEGNVEMVRQVAQVCSNNDTVIGNLIAEAFEKIGEDGIISIEESRGYDTTIKISDGIKFGLGWASPYFINNKAKAECELINPYILIYDRPITILKDFWPLLERYVQDNASSGVKRPLMIFCDRSEGEALATLTVNTSNGNFQACLVEMAHLGQHKRDFLDDIAAFTGATSINELRGIKLENVEVSHLGQAKKIVVGKGETVIIEGTKNETVYNALIDGLKEQESIMEESEEKLLLKRRIARLKGSVATLTIGGITEIEMKEAADRAEDAVRSVAASVEEGVIPGGGTAFLNISWPDIRVKTEGEVNGAILIMNVLETPLNQICMNAGVDYFEITKSILIGKSGSLLEVDNIPDEFISENIGYNAKTGTIEDLVKAGIIEPVKSNRCALQNAASLCCQILSSSFMITDCL